MRVELQAIAIARDHFERSGYVVNDVSRNRNHKGYDFVLRRDEQQLLVEVKGCSRKWQIPDLFETEFDVERRLVADLLCVVYIIEGKPESVCLIPRDAIPREYVAPKTGYRISSRFKKEKVLLPLLRSLELGSVEEGSS